jgi:hypothetical protein
MRAENVKMDGTAVQTTTTIDAVKSADQIAAEKEQQGSQSGGSGSSGSVGGLLGGLGRRVGNRGNSNNQAAASGRATFMTMTNEVLKVSTTVADADIAVPAGFKEAR